MLALVLSAILACRPALPAVEARTYAAIVTNESTRLDLDPFEIVALVDRETGWHANAVSSDGRYLGFGQIAWRFRCKRGAATVRRPRCSTERRRLLDGKYNLRVMFKIIETWRRLCLRTTGTGTGWISAYEGYNRPPDRMCGQERASTGRWQPAPSPPRVTREILARAEELRRLPLP